MNVQYETMTSAFFKKMVEGLNCQEKSTISNTSTCLLGPKLDLSSLKLGGQRITAMVGVMYAKQIYTRLPLQVLACIDIA